MRRADLTAPIQRLRNLAALPSVGLYVSSPSLPIVGASGAPARVVAMLEG